MAIAEIELRSLVREPPLVASGSLFAFMTARILNTNDSQSLAPYTLTCEIITVPEPYAVDTGAVILLAVIQITLATYRIWSASNTTTTCGIHLYGLRFVRTCLQLC